MIYILCFRLTQSSAIVEHASIPAHEKVFIDSAIRNISIAVQSRPVDSDDESEKEDSHDHDDSTNENGNDVHCKSDPDDVSFP